MTYTSLPLCGEICPRHLCSEQRDRTRHHIAPNAFTLPSIRKLSLEGSGTTTLSFINIQFISMGARAVMNFPWCPDSATLRSYTSGALRLRAQRPVKGYRLCHGDCIAGDAKPPSFRTSSSSQRGYAAVLGNLRIHPSTFLLSEHRSGE